MLVQTPSLDACFVQNGLCQALHQVRFEVAKPQEEGSRSFAKLKSQNISVNFQLLKLGPPNFSSESNDYLPRFVTPADFVADALQPPLMCFFSASKVKDIYSFIRLLISRVKPTGHCIYCAFTPSPFARNHQERRCRALPSQHLSFNRH